MFKDMEKRTKIFLLLILLGMGALIIPKASWLQEGEKMFNRKVDYDIYVQGSYDSLFIIRDVRILHTSEINGKKFLVILPDDFKVSTSEGYVRFDSIHAILPERKFIVNSQQKVKTY